MPIPPRCIFDGKGCGPTCVGYDQEHGGCRLLVLLAGIHDWLRDLALASGVEVINSEPYSGDERVWPEISEP